MTKQDRFFEQLDASIKKSLGDVQPSVHAVAATTGAVTAGVNEDMLKQFTERLDAMAVMLSPEGPIAKAIGELKGEQTSVIDAVEKTIERMEVVEKSGARPHSVNGDNNVAATQTVEKSSVNTEWDNMFRHLRGGGKVSLT